MERADPGAAPPTSSQCNGGLYMRNRVRLAPYHAAISLACMNLKRLVGRSRSTFIKCVVLSAVLMTGQLVWLDARAFQGGNPLIGSWKLVSHQWRADDGEIIRPYGENPSGVIMYDRGGHMSVHLASSTRSKFASEDSRRATADEIKAAFHSYNGYFGSYTYDSEKHAVTHHIQSCSIPNWSGVDQLRYVNLEGDILTLSSPPMLRDGKMRRAEGEWQRMR